MRLKHQCCYTFGPLKALVPESIKSCLVPGEELPFLDINYLKPLNQTIFQILAPECFSSEFLTCGLLHPELVGIDQRDLRSWQNEAKGNH